MSNDDSIVICTDGVWDSLNVNKVSKVVRYHCTPEIICKMATKNGTTDDVTAVIITKHEVIKHASMNCFTLFKRNGSNSSLSSEENVTTIKVPV